MGRPKLTSPLNKSNAQKPNFVIVKPNIHGHPGAVGWAAIVHVFGSEVGPYIAVIGQITPWTGMSTEKLWPLGWAAVFGDVKVNENVLFSSFFDSHGTSYRLIDSL